ncbi:MAG: recombination mediator protein UvsY [Bacilli bacterium]
MTLTELKDELTKDLPINLTDLQYEAANNPVLHGKWLRYLVELKVQQKKLSNDKVKALKARLDYYTGRGDEICLDQYDKTELRSVIPADTDVMKADTAMAVIEIMIEFCKGALDGVKNRGFAIKHIIDQRVLESGR